MQNTNHKSGGKRSLTSQNNSCVFQASRGSSELQPRTDEGTAIGAFYFTHSSFLTGGNRTLFPSSPNRSFYWLDMHFHFAFSFVFAHVAIFKVFVWSFSLRGDESFHHTYGASWGPANISVPFWSVSCPPLVEILLLKAQRTFHCADKIRISTCKYSSIRRKFSFSFFFNRFVVFTMNKKWGFLKIIQTYRGRAKPPTYTWSKLRTTWSSSAPLVEYRNNWVDVFFSLSICYHIFNKVKFKVTWWGIAGRVWHYLDSGRQSLACPLGSRIKVLNPQWKAMIYSPFFAVQKRASVPFLSKPGETELVDPSSRTHYHLLYPPLNPPESVVTEKVSPVLLCHGGDVASNRNPRTTKTQQSHFLFLLPL